MRKKVRDRLNAELQDAINDCVRLGLWVDEYHPGESVQLIKADMKYVAGAYVFTGIDLPAAVRDAARKLAIVPSGWLAPGEPEPAGMYDYPYMTLHLGPADIPTLPPQPYRGVSYEIHIPDPYAAAVARAIEKENRRRAAECGLPWVSKP